MEFFATCFILVKMNAKRILWWCDIGNHFKLLDLLDSGYMQCYALLGLLVALFSRPHPFLSLVALSLSLRSPGSLRELQRYLLSLAVVWWLSCLVLVFFFEGRGRTPDPTIPCGLVWSSSLLFVWCGWPIRPIFLFQMRIQTSGADADLVALMTSGFLEDGFVDDSVHAWYNACVLKTQQNIYNFTDYMEFSYQNKISSIFTSIFNGIRTFLLQ